MPPSSPSAPASASSPSSMSCITFGAGAGTAADGKLGGPLRPSSARPSAESAVVSPSGEEKLSPSGESLTPAMTAVAPLRVATAAEWRGGGGGGGGPLRALGARPVRPACRTVLSIRFVRRCVTPLGAALLFGRTILDVVRSVSALPGFAWGGGGTP